MPLKWYYFYNKHCLKLALLHRIKHQKRNRYSNLHKSKIIKTSFLFVHYKNYVSFFTGQKIIFDTVSSFCSLPDFNSGVERILS